MADSSVRYLTSHRITRYEFSTALGYRALQISQSAPSSVNTAGMMDPVLIAMKEFEEGKSPVTVSRKKPNGTKEVIEVNYLDASRYVKYNEEFNMRRPGFLRMFA